MWSALATTKASLCISDRYERILALPCLRRRLPGRYAVCGGLAAFAGRQSGHLRSRTPRPACSGRERLRSGREVVDGEDSALGPARADALQGLAPDQQQVGVLPGSTLP